MGKVKRKMVFGEREKWCLGKWCGGGDEAKVNVTVHKRERKKCKFERTL